MSSPTYTTQSANRPLQYVQVNGNRLPYFQSKQELEHAFHAGQIQEGTSWVAPQDNFGDVDSGDRIVYSSGFLGLTAATIGVIAKVIIITIAAAVIISLAGAAITAVIGAINAARRAKVDVIGTDEDGEKVYGVTTADGDYVTVGSDGKVRGESKNEDFGDAIREAAGGIGNLLLAGGVAAGLYFGAKAFSEKEGDESRGQSMGESHVKPEEPRAAKSKAQKASGKKSSKPSLSPTKKKLRSVSA